MHKAGCLHSRASQSLPQGCWRKGDSLSAPTATREVLFTSQVRNGPTRCEKQVSVLVEAQLDSRPGMTAPSFTGQDPSQVQCTGLTGGQTWSWVRGWGSEKAAG